MLMVWSTVTARKSWFLIPQRPVCRLYVFPGWSEVGSLRVQPEMAAKLALGVNTSVVSNNFE